MNVKMLKLTTGEELIVNIVRETGRGVAVKHPLRIHLMKDSAGNVDVGFGRWSMIMDPEAEVEFLYSGRVADPVKVLSEVADSYITQTSGIVLPPTASGKQIVLG